jgi:hypothetical protein
MFDDILSATALIGITGTFVAAVATGLAAPLPAQRTAGAQAPTGTPTVPAQAAAPMPVYDLPRVVVTGNRLRDGDVLAENRGATPAAGARP